MKRTRTMEIATAWTKTSSLNGKQEKIGEGSYKSRLASILFYIPIKTKSIEARKKVNSSNLKSL